MHQEMLASLVTGRRVTFDRVLMDSWCRAKAWLLFIESLSKFCCVTLKCNRQVDGSGGVLKYKRVDDLGWNSVDLTLGKTIKIKEFPKEHRVKLFRLVVSDNRTDWVIANELSQLRWVIHKKCVPFAGRLSSFTENPSKSPELRSINAEKR